MDVTTLKIARWHLRCWLGRMTWPWLVAGALLAFGVGLYLSVVEPARKELEGIRQNLLVLQEEIRVAEHHDTRLVKFFAPNQLAMFYQFFPSERSIPDLTEKIFSVAAENKLTVRQAEYQVIRDKTSKLLLYQITLPVKGTYPNLRGFIEKILSDLPIASVDNVKFERQEIGEDGIKATVSLTLHLGRES